MFLIHEILLFQTQRVIENNLDKAKIKYETAKKIQKSYQAIVKCLEEVRMKTYLSSSVCICERS